MNTNEENKRISEFVEKTKLTLEDLTKADLTKFAELNIFENNKIIQINNINLITNYYNKKVQIFIERFPDYLILVALRAGRFEWSDKNNVWERDLTDEAIEAGKNILKSIK